MDRELKLLKMYSEMTDGISFFLQSVAISNYTNDQLTIKYLKRCLNMRLKLLNKLTSRVEYHPTSYFTLFLAPIISMFKLNFMYNQV
jgi:hypothetical protein